MTTSGRQFELILENAPIGLAVITSLGEIQYANAELSRLVDRPASQLVGFRFQDFLASECAASFVQALRLLSIGEQSTYDHTCRAQASPNTPRWWDVGISYVGSESFSPFLLCLVRDTTQEREDEARLRREKEDAERATRTKSAFLANMSHEIRTPIHTITGMTELLLQTDLDEEQHDYAEQTRFAAEVLLGLINDILDFSKIEAGKLSLEEIDFDFVATVEDAVDMLSLEAHKKGLEVIMSIDPRVPRFLRGDPIRVRQIIVNLFNNAVKFTHSGEIELSAVLVDEKAATEKHPGAARVQVSVRDSGVGIPAEKLGALFQAFSQVDSSTTRKFGGTGLGLSICKNLVAMMHGEIGVSSQEGEGATFTFAVPFPTSLQQPQPEQEMAITPNERALIVDDNARARAVVAGYLRGWGFDVSETTGGPEGLASLRTAAEAGSPYALALVDLSMPGMDGWQFASEVNADRSINSTRLVLMSPTGQTAREAKMKLLKWFDAYVDKPLRTDELRRAIVQAITPEFELDVADDLSEDSEDLEDLEPIVLDRSEDLSHLVILVAEDHFVNQQLFRTILSKRGYSVIVADNGKEVLQVTESQSVDLIFMDVQMPEMNGYEATAELRRRGITVPIVAVTANALSGERETCIAAGMDDYLTKPFRAEDLDPILQRTLGPLAKPRERNARETEQTDSFVPELIEAEAPIPVEMEPVQSPGDDPCAPDRVFDYDDALSAFMGNKDVLNRVLIRFADRLPDQLERINTLMDGEEYADARVEAHAIKGGARNIAALELGDAAEHLEDALRDCDLPQARTAFPAVHAATERYRDRIARCVSAPE